MCDVCKEAINKIDASQLPHISSLIEALHPGHVDDGWEPSEPMSVGGPAGQYPLRAPFTGDCQFKIDNGSCGASPATFIVSSTRKQSAPGFASTDQGTGENSPIDGFVGFLPATNTIPIASEWYNVRGSGNTIYVVISQTTASAYLTIKFRQKR